MGKKTWLPGKTLSKFITSTFGIPQRKQKEIIERISDAVADIASLVCELMNGLAGFRDTGKRMLMTWSEGVKILPEPRMFALGPWKSHEAFEEISDPPRLEKPRIERYQDEAAARTTIVGLLGRALIRKNCANAFCIRR